MGVAFNGFSPSGNVTGEPVYVNYGRVEDFDELEALGVNVSGKICLSRYGKIFRGNKVWNAQQRGAVGVILYLDPVEVALEGTDPEHVYPKTWWMPETAMQRGSVFTGDGDPLTPGYPSVEGAYRYAMKDTLLPKIPSQPIGYGDARNILSLLSGQPAPTNWSGGFNITLHLGPGFAGDDSDKRIRLQVYNKFNQTVNYNVIGYIRGDIEPDRYVILGNHRDAWGFGAVDPSSGTAEMLEVSRILGKLHKNGWKPRRTLVFCSWAAEEYGLIGSTEWVEDKLPQLMDRTVAYVNSDVCASGTKFQVAASPLLASVVQEMTRYVEDPGSPEKSVYDTWKDYHSDGMGDEKEPRVRTLSSGSDHSPFAFYAGIPSIDISWVVDKKIYPIATYPAYHTAYETFDLMSRLIDPKFIYHQSCSRLNGLLLHRLSGSLLLPYNLTTYGEELQMAFHSLEEKGILEKLEDQGISLGLLKETIDNFTKTATEWHKHTKETDLDNPLMVRQVNDQMMLVERTFIKPTGLPEQPLKRNIAFAPSKYDSYSSHGFPAIHDLSYGIDNLSDEDKHARWEEIKLHISDLTVALRQAKAVLDRNFYL
ncbi:N-acetylated-alpha-linked acidic dipeptidase 2-like [Tachypleus tridentatus]|uniref:N-acetylated-alpha-linked acidic dipeptidase 2-like n=1 Tax=Tachypleus tridentatus TaxID=6853 RepID=UPI003FD04954